MSNTIKIQIISDYQDYKKGQIVELDEKEAVTLLTNGLLKKSCVSPISESLL